MAERKDAKGRKLRPGESQRPDGRYQFKYKDAKGKTKFAYSWTLTEKDFTPTGKKRKPCLRKLEGEIQRDSLDSISPENMTVLELIESYVATRTGVCPNAKTGYKTVLNLLAKNEFGQRKISSIGILDAKSWLIRLQRDLGKFYSSVHSIRGVVRPAFQLAEESDLIRKNPFNFELIDVLINDSVRREALGKGDERRFLEFVRSDKTYLKYYDGFYILLNTGLRIFEFVGLTFDDIDFEQGSIRVCRQLQRDSEGNYYVGSTKTENGEHYVPMSDAVADCFRRVIDKRIKPDKEPVVDGASGFVFLDKNGNPEVALHWENHFCWCIKKHNSIYKNELLDITPHECCYTFCSRMARNGMSPAKLKYIMGHSDIAVTMNVYTHIDFADVKEDVRECIRGAVA